MDTEMRRKDDEMVYDLEKRFDRHLEIYANNGKELAGLKVEVANVVREVASMHKSISENYVTIDQFSPIKLLVYGSVSLILTAVVTAGMTLIVIK